MGLLDIFKSPDINQGVEEWKNTEGGVLIDVRNAGEYKEGHIPGSKNVPLKEVDAILEVVPDKKTPLFVHCLSGVRSSQAVARMVESQLFPDMPS